MELDGAARVVLLHRVIDGDVAVAQRSIHVAAVDLDAIALDVLPTQSLMQTGDTTGMKHGMYQVFLFACSHGEVRVELFLRRGHRWRVVGFLVAVGLAQRGCIYHSLIGGEGVHPCREVGIGMFVVALERVGLSTVEDESISSKGWHDHTRIANTVHDVGVFHILTHLQHVDLRRTAHLTGSEVRILRSPETCALERLGLRNLGAVAVAFRHCSGTIDPFPIGIGGDDEQVGFVAGIDEGVVAGTAQSYAAQGLPVAQHVGRLRGQHACCTLNTTVKVRHVFLHIIKVETCGKSVGRAQVEVILRHRIDVVVDEWQPLFDVGSDILIEFSHRATTIGRRHRGLCGPHVRHTHGFMAGLAAIRQTEDVCQLEMAKGPAQQSLASLGIETLRTS